MMSSYCCPAFLVHSGRTGRDDTFIIAARQGICHACRIVPNSQALTGLRHGTARPRAAEPEEVPRLDDPQELHLERGRHVSYLIEKQGPVVRHLQQAGLSRMGAAEGPLDGRLREICSSEKARVGQRALSKAFAVRPIVRCSSFASRRKTSLASRFFSMRLSFR